MSVDAEFDTFAEALRAVLRDVGCDWEFPPDANNAWQELSSAKFYRFHDNGHCHDWIFPVTRNQQVQPEEMTSLTTLRGDSTQCKDYFLLQLHPPHFDLLKNDIKKIRDNLNKINTGNAISDETLIREYNASLNSVTTFRSRYHFHARKVIRMCKFKNSNRELQNVWETSFGKDRGIIGCRRPPDNIYTYYAECDTSTEYNSNCKAHYLWPKKETEPNNGGAQELQLPLNIDKNTFKNMIKTKLGALQTYAEGIYGIFEKRRNSTYHQTLQTVELLEKLLSYSTQAIASVENSIGNVSELDYTNKSVNSVVTGLNAVGSAASFFPLTAVLGFTTVALCTVTKMINNSCTQSTISTEVQNIWKSHLTKYGKCYEELSNALITTSRLQSANNFHAFGLRELEWTYKEMKFHQQLDAELVELAKRVTETHGNSSSQQLETRLAFYREMTFGVAKPINYSTILTRATFRHILLLNDCMMSKGQTLGETIAAIIGKSASNGQQAMNKLFANFVGENVVQVGTLASTSIPSIIFAPVAPAAAAGSINPAQTSEIVSETLNTAAEGLGVSSIPSSGLPTIVNGSSAATAPIVTAPIEVGTQVAPTMSLNSLQASSTNAVSCPPRFAPDFGGGREPPISFATSMQGNGRAAAAPRQLASVCQGPPLPGIQPGGGVGALPSTTAPTPSPVPSSVSVTHTSQSTVANLVQSNTVSGAEMANSVGGEVATSSSTAAGGEAAAVGGESAAAVGAGEGSASASGASSATASTMRIIGATITVILVAIDIVTTIRRWNEENVAVTHLKEIYQYLVANHTCLAQAKYALELELQALNPKGEDIPFVRPEGIDIRARSNLLRECARDGRQLEPNNGRATREQFREESNGRATRESTRR